MTKVDAAVDRGFESPLASAPPTLEKPQPQPQAPVEARSLSSITAIASNPPAYPRNPTQNKHDPLALYIVRVPGSKGMYMGFFPPFSTCPARTVHPAFELDVDILMVSTERQMCSFRR